MLRDFLKLVQAIWWVEMNNKGFLGSVTFQVIPKILKMKTCGFFKTKVKSYESNMKNIRSFWATLLIQFNVKMAPQTPADPESERFYKVPIDRLLGGGGGMLRGIA